MVAIQFLYFLFHLFIFTLPSPISAIQFLIVLLLRRFVKQVSRDIFQFFLLLFLLSFFYFPLSVLIFELFLLIELTKVASSSSNSKP
ncbi:hypothetical protein Lalb_Chr02g0148431 [Lupinus albus]|uniref:Uncharacterized protein n=1 Tax=Lupinus albus TaxID=3870 RepID=A0A6A4QVT5_LUPAL|nr:hypothetical protein Lalb_Chr02g0148431 [Lupinus albus]